MKKVKEIRGLKCPNHDRVRDNYHFLYEEAYPGARPLSSTEVLIAIATYLYNMNAVITYKEISDFIEKEFKIRPKFTTVDEKTFEVSYKPGVFMPTISVRFHIEAMRKDIVCLSYECGTPASLMIAGVVAYLEEKIPSGIEVNTTDKRVNIYPQRFKQLEKALEYVALSNITFEENSANVALTMV